MGGTGGRSTEEQAVTGDRVYLRGLRPGAPDGGMFMLVLLNPGAMEGAGALRTKAAAMSYSADWPSYLVHAFVSLVLMQA